MILIGQTNAIDWGQFGLAGAVIGGLFAFLVFMVKSHRDERKEWREDAGKRSEATNDVIKELSNVIRQSNENK